jgi:hypothetical protein
MGGEAAARIRPVGGGGRGRRKEAKPRDGRRTSWSLAAIERKKEQKMFLAVGLVFLFWSFFKKNMKNKPAKLFPISVSFESRQVDTTHEMVALYTLV